MSILVLAIIGAGVLAALAVAIYLVRLLLAIRRRGFGEGKPLSIPELGVIMRIPEWWVADTAARAGADHGEPARIRIVTGHHRGLLEILPGERFLAVQAAARDDGPEVRLNAALLEALRSLEIVLDEVDVRLESMPELGMSAGPQPPLRASVASAGRRGGSEAERSYFELHLIESEGTSVLLLYTNSVLQGYLDAFYIERSLATLRLRPHPEQA